MEYMPHLNEMVYVEGDVSVSSSYEDPVKIITLKVNADEIQPQTDICMQSIDAEEDLQLALGVQRARTGQFDELFKCGDHDGNSSVEAAYVEASSCDTVGDVSSVSLQNIMASHLDDCNTCIYKKDFERQPKLGEGEVNHTISNISAKFSSSTEFVSLVCNEPKVFGSPAEDVSLFCNEPRVTGSLADGASPVCNEMTVSDGMINSANLDGHLTHLEELTHGNNVPSLINASINDTDIPSIGSKMIGIVNQRHHPQTFGNSSNNERESNDDRLIVNTGTSSNQSNIHVSSQFRLSPGVARRILGPLISDASDKQEMITKDLPDKQQISNSNDEHIANNSNATNIKTESLDVQNEYDYVKYLRISSGVSGTPVSLECADLCESKVSSLVTINDGKSSSSYPTSKVSSQPTTTDSLSLSAVERPLPKLPLLEDGLSSGQNSDTDDGSDLEDENKLSSLKTGARDDEKSQNGHNRMPSTLEVEKAIQEIKLAIRKSRNQSLVSPTNEYLASSTENASQQPIWITRSHLDETSMERKNKTGHKVAEKVSASSTEKEGQLSDEGEEDGYELLLKRPAQTAIGDRKDYSDTDEETDELLNKPYSHSATVDIPELTTSPLTQSENHKSKSREVAVRDPNNETVLIQGVLFRASYLGSTQLISEGQPSKAMRMMQAQEAVGRIKAPVGEHQPSTEVDLFISVEKIMVLNTDLQEIMMDHSLRTISYIADIGEILVIMARRGPIMNSETAQHRTQTKICCHVFETDEAQLVAQSIGQAFQVAYMEFLKANGIESTNDDLEVDYQDVLNQQQVFSEELRMFANKEMQREIIVPKLRGEALGIVVVESGWGSMVPTVVLANMSPSGSAARCGQLNIGDQIISINNVSLVGLPLSTCQNYIKAARSQTVVRLVVVACSPVVEVLIKRPDIKYQLGFSVQNGVICSLLRGGIAERGGVRVGHRIIDINGVSVVAIPHDRIVKILATSVGEIHMKTMPMSIYRLLTGQDVPQYI